MLCKLASVHANLRVFIDPLLVFSTRFGAESWFVHAYRHECVQIIESFMPVAVLDRSPIFRSQKCQMLMDFLIRGLRPVLDRSPIFEKFMRKVAPFMRIIASFMQIIDFGEKICNFYDYM